MGLCLVSFVFRASRGVDLAEAQSCFVNIFVDLPRLPPHHDRFGFIHSPFCQGQKWYQVYRPKGIVLF